MAWNEREPALPPATGASRLPTPRNPRQTTISPSQVPTEVLATIPHMKSNDESRSGRGTVHAVRAAASVGPTDDFDTIITRLQVDDVFTLLGTGPLELVSPTARAFIDECCRFDDPHAFMGTHEVQRAHRVGEQTLRTFPETAYSHRVCRHPIGLATVQRIVHRHGAESGPNRWSILPEIHHRVKDNLQMISSLVNFQLEHAKNPETRAILRVTQARVHSIALIHEKLYRSPLLATIDSRALRQRRLNFGMGGAVVIVAMIEADAPRMGRVSRTPRREGI